MWPPRVPPSTALFAALLPLLLPSPSASAQTHAQPIPFSADLPVRTLLAERPLPSLPIWIESVSIVPAAPPSASPRSTVVRIRPRRLSSLIHSLELRITVSPGLGGTASLSAWSETGTPLFESPPFGSPDSVHTEVLRVAASNLSYLDLRLPGDGSRLRGLFVTALKTSAVLHPIDFPPPALLDAFTPSHVAATQLEEADRLLLGRVSALLDPGPFTVEEESPTVLQFDLPKIPSAAVLSFEARNLIASDPIRLWLNGEELAPVSVSYPDLADPAWRLRSSAGLPQNTLQYSGWIRAQILLPTTVLAPGINEITFQQPSLCGAAELRRIELQVKNVR
ncbi:MAG: hypothetical protein RLZZ142_1359 [Verrucomicrobiota bacterium]